MKWKLSDGTEVSIGGDVKGGSDLAKRLRADVTAVQRGFSVSVFVEVAPCSPRSLDLDDAQLMHEWLRATARRAGASIKEAPELEPIERRDPPLPEGADDETIY